MCSVTHWILLSLHRGCCRALLRLLVLLGVVWHELLAAVAIRTNLLGLLRQELRQVHRLREHDVILVQLDPMRHILLTLFWLVSNIACLVGGFTIDFQAELLLDHGHVGCVVSDTHLADFFALDNIVPRLVLGRVVVVIIVVVVRVVARSIIVLELLLIVICLV